MPPTFTGQPFGPVVEKDGTATRSFSGYWQQFDLVETGTLLGRWSPTIGPIQWVTLGEGLSLSSEGVLSASGGDPSFDTLALTEPLGAGNTLDVTGGAIFRTADISPDPGDDSGPALRMGFDSGSDAGFINAINTGVALKPLLVQPSGGGVHIGGTSAPLSAVRITGLPTSSAGLAAGDLWVDTGAGNVLKVV